MEKRNTRILVLGVILLAVVVCAIGAVAAMFIARTVVREVRQDSAVVSEFPEIDRRDETEPEVQSGRGLLIMSVEPDSAAENAGLRHGDILLEVDGEPVNTPRDLSRLVDQYRAGERLTLLLMRGGERERLRVRLVEDGVLGVRVMSLAEEDERAAVPETEPPADIPDMPDTPEMPGQPSIPGQIFTLPGARAIVENVRPDTPAEAAGLEAGDIITNVDDQAVLTSDELIAAIGGREPGERVRLILRRGDETIEVHVRLGTHPEDASRGYLGVDLAPGGRMMPGVPER